MRGQPIQTPPPRPPTVLEYLLEHRFELSEAEAFLERYRIPETARIGEPGLTPDELAELVHAWEAERLEDDEGR